MPRSHRVTERRPDPLMVINALALVIRAVGGLALPALLARAVDAALQGSSAFGRPVWWLAACLAVIGLGDVLVVLSSAYLVTSGTARRRVRLVEHLLAVGSSSRLGAGDAISRVVRSASDAAAAPAAMASAAVSLAGSVVAAVFVWVLDWRCGLTFCVLVPLVVVATRGPLAQLQARQTSYLGAQGKLAARLLQALAGCRSIRAAGTAEQEISRVLLPLAGMSAAGRSLWLIQRNLAFRVRASMALVQVGTLSVAGLLLGLGQLAPANLIAVVGFTTLALAGIDQIDTVITLVMSASSRSRVDSVLELPRLRTGTASVPPGMVSVAWRGVTVGEDGTGVQDVNLDLPAGCSLALVGHSGSGKSLLAAMVAGLVQPDRGEVLLNGAPIADLDPVALHQAVGMAFDVPVLLGASVAESIAYPRSVDIDDVRSAARLARADLFLQRLPLGYDTKLNAAPMSGGELQRVGLARAFAAKTPVLVLDDATSGLDAITELELQQVITGEMPGKTRLLTAHRAETAARCHRVAWLEAGRVRAVGTHAELWGNPEYRALFARDNLAEQVTV